MPINTRRAAGKFMRPGEDLDTIIRGNMAGTSTAMVTEDAGVVCSTGREKTHQNLPQAWLRLWQPRRLQRIGESE